MILMCNVGCVREEIDLSAENKHNQCGSSVNDNSNNHYPDYKGSLKINFDANVISLNAVLESSGSAELQSGVYASVYAFDGTYQSAFTKYYSKTTEIGRAHV